MTDEIAPFEPAAPSGQTVEIDAQLRAAAALEYIAAQLGQINARLKRAEDAAAPTLDPPPEIAGATADEELESLVDRSLR
ncbi:MAG: hypothetical protein ABR970_14055 [Roseiarcus sp.]|jgi:hypothetical protein